MLPCENCEKRESCVAPCKELEDDLKRVEVSLREIPFSDLDTVDLEDKAQYLQDISSYFTDNSLDFPFKTQRELKNKCLYMFYFRSMTHKQIAHSLSYLGHGKGRKKVTVSSVSNCIKRAKSEIRLLFSINDTGSRISTGIKP